MWWGRWDLDPGSPAPQAGILDQTSREIPRLLGFNLLLDYDPAYAEYNAKIIKTLQSMTADGRKRNTVKGTMKTLRELDRHVDLMNPDAVKLYISNLTKKNSKEPLADQTKQKLVNNYNYFVIHDGLTWKKPVYKWDTKTPIAPTKTQAEQIIAAAPSLNAATIFRILQESGFEGEELHNTTEPDIDTQQGKITVAGTKGHRGRAYQFSQATADLLRLYMAKHQRLHPFPRPNIMGDAWREARKRAAQQTGNQTLKNIPLKGLRNLSGFIVYEKTQDPWRVMLHMGHKKIDTTRLYLSTLMAQTNSDGVEYISKAAQTKEEAMRLIDAGFNASKQ